MFKIAIYSCKEKAADMIKKMVEKILQEEGIEYDLSILFDNQNKAIELIKNMYNKFDVYICDISKEKINNIDNDFKMIAKALNTTIIFTSSINEISLKNYVMNNRFYLLNPISYEVLKRVIIYDYVKYIVPRYIIIEKGAQIFKIFEKDIIYVEVENRGINVNMLNKTIYVPEKISSFHKRLYSFSFMKCHKSFILNMNKVRQIKRYEAVMDNERIVPISKSNYNYLKERILEIESGQEQLIGLLA